MGVLSRAQIPLITTCKSTSNFPQLPEIDITSPKAGSLLVSACRDFGFFKVLNHGVPVESMTRLESHAVDFFSKPLPEKEGTAPGWDKAPGYGNGRIGQNGDVGWVEHLIFNSDLDLSFLNLPLREREDFRDAAVEYVNRVRKMSCEVLEIIADGLGIMPREKFSRMISDKNSDFRLRLNFFPPCEGDEGLAKETSMLGFGEHTDPQIISVMRSNPSSDFQICLPDGRWASVNTDTPSLFVIVGDCFQVMTNGRFRSAKHRVVVEGKRGRYSMIYFGAPAPEEKISVVESLMEEGEEKKYREFTWSEFKSAANKTRLADNRIEVFEVKKKGGGAAEEEEEEEEEGDGCSRQKACVKLTPLSDAAFGSGGFGNRELDS